MFEITIDNAADYLRTRHGISPTHVEALSGGVSNVVLRVEAGGERFVLKQSRPQLRTRDAWFSDLERIYREQEVMQALADWLPPLTVPTILFVDRDNYVFAMSHAPPAAVWKEQLLAGDIDLAMGQLTGRVLGMMHAASAIQAETFAAFGERTAFVQLRVDPFYRRIQERCPDVAAAVQPLIDSMMTRSEALCHGDYTPKNMLVHDQGFMLVDYETAHFGDPAMDLGLFLAHLLLKAVRRPELRSEYFALIQTIWETYRHQVKFLDVRDLERRGVAHWGACLLARIDGTSPVDYLPEHGKRDCVRRLARTLLLEGVHAVEEVIDTSERLLGDPAMQEAKT